MSGARFRGRDDVATASLLEFWIVRAERGVWSCSRSLEQRENQTLVVVIGWDVANSGNSIWRRLVAGSPLWRIQLPDQSDRSRQVIALCGDGGFNMLMCEFLAGG